MASNKGNSRSQDQEPSNSYQDRFPGSVPVHSGGTMLQWEKVGQEVIGTFVEIHPYKNGYIANVMTEEGPVAFSAPAMLADALKRLKNGDRIAIVFSGERPPKKRGQSPLKLFEVYQMPDER